MSLLQAKYGVNDTCKPYRMRMPYTMGLSSHYEPCKRLAWTTEPYMNQSASTRLALPHCDGRPIQWIIFWRTPNQVSIGQALTPSLVKVNKESSTLNDSPPSLLWHWLWQPRWGKPDDLFAKFPIWKTFPSWYKPNEQFEILRVTGQAWPPSTCTIIITKST